MKAIAAVLVVLALAIAIIPQFTNCSAMGRSLTIANSNGKTVPMKCHWTAQAELAVGAPLFVLGAATAFTKKKESRRILALAGTVLGAFAILLPTALIGVCASNDMLCNSFMKPAMIVSGILVIGVSIVGLVISERKAE
jgi:hypothetical protein